MQVSRLSLSGFRNYELAETEFDPGINVITGENAQGKTNMLEAVYMLTCGRSFRTRFDRELIGFGREGAEIRAGLYSAQREQSMSIVLRRGQKKSISVNGVKKSPGELTETLRAVLFSPDDLNMIREGPAARRRLMDMAISQLRPGYIRLLADFGRLYENKTRILRDYRENLSMMDTLDEFSDGICRVSASIIRYRASFARRLAAAASEIHRDFSGSDELLSITYRTVGTVCNPEAPAAEIYEQLLEHQRAHRSAELSAGQCLCGAHRDDLDIEINGNSARSFASQGQTRTAALSIKLAEREICLAETGEYPVLLLDDVLSELDSRRQEFVLNRIGGGQTLITCCEDEHIAEKTGGRVITVRGGAIVKKALNKSTGQPGDLFRGS